MDSKQIPGELVALPARHVHKHHGCFLSERQHGWNACLDEIAKLGPLYTRADPDEVERLESLLRASRTSLDNCALQIENLQAMLEAEKKQHAQVLELATRRWNYIAKQDAQLVERDALLREVFDAFDGVEGHPWIPGGARTQALYLKLKSALSASAEPNAL